MTVRLYLLFFVNVYYFIRVGRSVDLFYLIRGGKKNVSNPSAACNVISRLSRENLIVYIHNKIRDVIALISGLIRHAEIVAIYTPLSASSATHTQT